MKLVDIDKHLAGLVNRILDGGLRDQIEQTVIKKEHFVNKKFVRFIEKNTDQSFWDDPSRPTRGRINPRDFTKLLNRIYAQRSDTLHNGRPFPPYIFWPPTTGEEIPFAIVAFEDGGRTWKSKDYIPYPHFFERLVNHVLKNHLKTHQVTVGNAGIQRERLHVVEGEQ